MTGWVVVLEPDVYEDWLAGADVAGPPVSVGETLFTRLGCVTCHHEASGARGPDLAGLFGSQVTLKDGETITADEDYVRESIMFPQAKLVAGYPPLMPTYRGQIKEDDVFQLIAYIKELQTETTG